MKSFTRSLVAILLAVILCSLGFIAAIAEDGDEAENVINAGEEKTVYVMIAGTYCLTLSDGSYEVTDANGDAITDLSSIELEDRGYVVVKNTGDTAITYSIELADPGVEGTQINLGSNAAINIGGWETAMVWFVAEQVGTYTIDAENVVVIVEDGNVTESIPASEFKYVSSYMNETVYLTLGSANFEDITVEITLNYSEEIDDAGKEGTQINLGENDPIAIGGWDNVLVWFVAEQVGTYSIDAEGVSVIVLTADGSELVPASEFKYVSSYMNETVYLTLGSANFEDITVEITLNYSEEIDDPGKEGTQINLGANDAVSIPAWGTTLVWFVAENIGTYTIDAEGVVVIVENDNVTELIPASEFKYVSSYMNEMVYLTLGSENLEDITVEITLNYSEEIDPDVTETIDIVLGANDPIEIGGWSTVIVTFIAEKVVTYTINAEGVSVIVENGNITDVVPASEFKYVSSYMNEQVYLTLCSTDYNDIAPVITLNYSEDIEDDTPVLNIGVNTGVAVSGEGTVVAVETFAPGRYTVSGEGVVVGVATEDGVDWEVSYIDVTDTRATVYFVVALENVSANTENVDLTVVCSDIPVPTYEAVVGSNENVAISGEGTLVTVTADKDGVYTISCADANVVVGVVVDGVVDYTTASIEAKAGDVITFVAATADFEDATATLNVAYSELKADEDGDATTIVVMVILAIVAALGCATVIKTRA